MPYRVVPCLQPDVITGAPNEKARELVDLATIGDQEIANDQVLYVVKRSGTHTCQFWFVFYIGRVAIDQFNPRMRACLFWMHAVPEIRAILYPPSPFLLFFVMTNGVWCERSSTPNPTTFKTTTMLPT